MFSVIITVLVSVVLWSIGFPEHAVIYSCLVGIINTVKTCSSHLKERRMANKEESNGNIVIFEKEKEKRKKPTKANDIAINDKP